MLSQFTVSFFLHLLQTRTSTLLFQHLLPGEPRCASSPSVSSSPCSRQEPRGTSGIGCYGPDAIHLTHQQCENTEQQLKSIYTRRPFNGLFSKTTRVSRHQKCLTSLDFNDARDDRVHVVASARPFAPRCRQTATPVPHHSFLQAVWPTNSVIALKPQQQPIQQFRKYCRNNASSGFL